MKLNRKEQLETICTALALGLFDYQRNAALQTDYGNQDGVLHATSRMVFLRYVNDYFNSLLRQSGKDTGTANEQSFTSVLEELAVLAGVNVRNTLQYSAVDKAPVDGDARGPAPSAESN